MLTLKNKITKGKTKTKKVKDIRTRKLIYKTLKNKYMNYKESVWEKILTENDWEKYIDENWLDKNNKRDHGGYITPDEMKKIGADLVSKINLYQLLKYLRKSIKKRNNFNDSILPKELPKLVVNDNITSIEVPTCSFNSKSYQKKYINTLRNFLYTFKTDILELDLSLNGGGKTEVIASGLLPIFLLQCNKILAYLEDSSGKKAVLKIVNGEIQNLPVKVKKTVKMAHIPKKIIVKMGNQTASAAEQIILSLHVLRDVLDIEFTGYPTAGFTTWIDYINLPNGGAIEFPVGNMTSVHGVKARANSRIYPTDLNP